MKKILSLIVLFSCGHICADAYENLKAAQAKFHKLIYQGGALPGVAGSAPEVAYISGFFYAPITLPTDQESTEIYWALINKGTNKTPDYVSGDVNNLHLRQFETLDLRELTQYNEYASDSRPRFSLTGHSVLGIAAQLPRVVIAAPPPPIVAAVASSPAVSSSSSSSSAAVAVLLEAPEEQEIEQVQRYYTAEEIQQLPSEKAEKYNSFKRRFPPMSAKAIAKMVSIPPKFEEGAVLGSGQNLDHSSVLAGEKKKVGEQKKVGAASNAPLSMMEQLKAAMKVRNDILSKGGDESSGSDSGSEEEGDDGDDFGPVAQSSSSSSKVEPRVQAPPVGVVNTPSPVPPQGIATAAPAFNPTLPVAASTPVIVKSSSSSSLQPAKNYVPNSFQGFSPKPSVVSGGGGSAKKAVAAPPPSPMPVISSSSASAAPAAAPAAVADGAATAPTPTSSSASVAVGGGAASEIPVDAAGVISYLSNLSAKLIKRDYGGGSSVEQIAYLEDLLVKLDAIEAKIVSGGAIKIPLRDSQKVGKDKSDIRQLINTALSKLREGR